MPILFVFLFGILAVAGAVFWLLTLIGWTTALSVYFIATCVLLILVVLIQKPKGGGLAGAFGGAGGGQQAVFGAKAGDMFTLVTVCLFLLFLLLGMGLVYSTRLDDALADVLPDEVPAVEPTGDSAGSQAPAAPQGDQEKKTVDDGKNLLLGEPTKKDEANKDGAEKTSGAVAPKTDPGESSTNRNAEPSQGANP